MECLNCGNQIYSNTSGDIVICQHCGYKNNIKQEIQINEIAKLISEGEEERVSPEEEDIRNYMNEVLKLILKTAKENNRTIDYLIKLDTPNIITKITENDFYSFIIKICCPDLNKGHLGGDELITKFKKEILNNYSNIIEYFRMYENFEDFEERPLLHEPFSLNESEIEKEHSRITTLMFNNYILLNMSKPTSMGRKDTEIVSMEDKIKKTVNTGIKFRSPIRLYISESDADSFTFGLVDMLRYYSYMLYNRTKVRFINNFLHLFSRIYLTYLTIFFRDFYINEFKRKYDGLDLSSQDKDRLDAPINLSIYVLEFNMKHMSKDVQELWRESHEYKNDVIKPFLGLSYYPSGMIGPMTKVNDSSLFKFLLYDPYNVLFCLGKVLKGKGFKHSFHEHGDVEKIDKEEAEMQPFVGFDPDIGENISTALNDQDVKNKVFERINKFLRDKRSDSQFLIQIFDSRTVFGRVSLSI